MHAIDGVDYAAEGVGIRGNDTRVHDCRRQVGQLHRVDAALAARDGGAVEEGGNFGRLQQLGRVEGGRGEVVVENGDDDAGKTATGLIGLALQLGDEGAGGGALGGAGGDVFEIDGGLRDGAVVRHEESEGRPGEHGVPGWEVDAVQ